MTPFKIDIQKQVRTAGVDSKKLKQVVRYVLAQLDAPQAEVTVLVVGHEAIRSLKREYFDMDVTTDVISFNVSDESAGADGAALAEYDIVVNAEMAAEIAAQRGTEFMPELALYVVHGLLHQLGYDDHTPAKAKRMHVMEDRLLDELGFGKVYFGKG
jgi:probable rRNA maturation factor